MPTSLQVSGDGPGLGPEQGPKLLQRPEQGTWTGGSRPAATVIEEQERAWPCLSCCCDLCLCVFSAAGAFGVE